MYELILPPNQHICPRVATYLRKATNFQFKQDPNFQPTSDLLAIEISKPTEKFLLINLYNEKELGENSRMQQNGRTTIQRVLLDTNLRITSPFLLLGDFNNHYT